MNQSIYQQFIYLRTYSRWLPQRGRREKWPETVERYVSYLEKCFGPLILNRDTIKNAIINYEVMPSMRLLWSAGEACDASQASAYNCSFIVPKQLRDFGEIMFLLMNGCGVGFSCEREIVHKLPVIHMQRGGGRPRVVFEDSREGWAEGFVTFLELLYDGYSPIADLSKLRPRGTRLKTMGGTASGPEPLKSLLDFCTDKVCKQQGWRLKTINVHDIICKIGQIVVMGGVRRSSEISLSDVDDEDLRLAKSGEFWKDHPHRSSANNSVAYKERPAQRTFVREWLELMEGGTGERGIFSRSSLVNTMPARRLKINPDVSEMGTNPCGEIFLRNKEFCNLTEIVARVGDTERSMLRKMEIAAVLGTYQSMYQDFTYLGEIWRANCKQERLLGVSITGQMDVPGLWGYQFLRKLRRTARDVNRAAARRLKIKPSVAITCVKPSGTVSQLVNSSSGLHTRFAEFYIRRVRAAKSDPLTHFMYEGGVSMVEENDATVVFSFPQKSPPGALTRYDLTSLQQLTHWKKLKLNYTEHNPSCTIYVGQDDWLEVAQWLWDNWKILGGLSFLPIDDHIYENAPYEEITGEEHEERVKAFPKLDFSKLKEDEDNTTGSKELACVGGECEV